MIFIQGGRHDDFISGGSGDDDLRGLAGNDILIGGDGDDFLLVGLKNFDLVTKYLKTQTLTSFSVAAAMTFSVADSSTTSCMAVWELTSYEVDSATILFMVALEST